MASPEFERGGVVNYLIDQPVRALFGLFSTMPHHIGLRVAGFVSAHILSPVFGGNRRIRKNLRHVWPQMSAPEMKRLCREVSDNSARLMVESFNITGFMRHARRASLIGDGKAALLEALDNQKPVVLVSGHFGNYQVLRVLMADLGHELAAIYRPMNNAFTNKRYIQNMDKIAHPNYPRGMKGTKGLLTHLRKGGAIALLNDQASYAGETLTFLGMPALTMTSAAELALKYNALLVPYYGIRQANGTDFDVVVENAIPHSDAVTMTQALNDSLEVRVREQPGQWFWMHRRWKGL